MSRTKTTHIDRYTTCPACGGDCASISGTVESWDDGADEFGDNEDLTVECDECGYDGGPDDALDDHVAGLLARKNWAQLAAVVRHLGWATGIRSLFEEPATLLEGLTVNEYCALHHMIAYQKAAEWASARANARRRRAFTLQAA